jgi:hypothetical protein
MRRHAFLKYSLLHSRDAMAWGTALLSLALLLWLLSHGLVTLVAALFLVSVLFVTSVISKPFAICLTLAYLFLLGDIRRIFGMLIGFPELDPLLLVGPIISILLALPLLLRLRLKDPLSKATLALMAVMFLEIFNPHQGSITVGLGGAMFYVVPLLWFWIGREYGNNVLVERLMYKVTIPLAVGAGLLGLWQSYVGFLPWESAWMKHVSSTYTVMNLAGGFIRSFGFSVNVTEYADLLLVGAVCTLAAFFAGRRAYGLLFPFLGVMLFLAASRTAIVRLLFAVAAAWALSSKAGKGWAVRLPLALAIGFGLLAFSLSQISSGGSGKDKDAASASTEHQVQGLEHPLDSKRSTAGVHASMFLGGFTKALSYPIGYGLGSVTLGAPKLGSDDNKGGSTEVDISDAFVSMGIVGGVLYLYTIYLVVRQALAFGRIAPRYIGLPAVAILAALVGSWIANGQYGIGPLVWFVIGFISRDSYRGIVRAPRKKTISSVQASSPPAESVASRATYL